MGTSKPRSRKKTAGADASVPVTTEERHRMITEAAYYLAERRGFSGGSAEDDWLQAEREIDRALRAEPQARPQAEPQAGAPLAAIEASRSEAHSGSHV
jgi:hypothetical protein